jgi:phage terminase Nu1 subunit (DNA packaging protein)
MPRPRKYIDNAEKQAAYRERHGMLTERQRLSQAQDRIIELRRYEMAARRIQDAMVVINMTQVSLDPAECLEILAASYEETAKRIRPLWKPRF